MSTYVYVYDMKVHKYFILSREGVVPPLHLGVEAIEKGDFRSPSITVANFTLL